MKQLLLFASLLVQSILQLSVSAANQPGDAFDHVKMAYIPEGTRWVEIGFFVITPNNWTTVTTTYTNFVDPVVFLSLPQLAGDTSDEGVAQSLRVSNTKLDRINAGLSYYSFDAKIFDVNTTYCSTWKFYTPKELQVNSSFIGWIVAEKGKFNVSGAGFIIQTDTINRTDREARETYNLFQSFAPRGVCDGGQDCAMTGVPIVDLLTIGQLQTIRYNRYLLLRAVSIDTVSVVWLLQPHDSLDPLGYYFPDPGEDYAWMIFQRGVRISCVEDLAIESYKYFVTNLKLIVSYQNTFLVPPALFGMISTLVGRDSVSLRMFDLSTTGASFITQEDKCESEPTDHVNAEDCGVLVIGRITTKGSTVCGATFNDNQPTSFPTFSPTLKPDNDTYCAEVALYDTFGDGWGDNVALQVWGPEFETQYIYYDCPNEFPQIICYPPDVDVYFDIVTFEPPAVETWEMFWTIRTIGKLGSGLDENGDIFVPQFHLGDYNTNMTVFNTEVDVFNAVNTENQTCDRCQHPPKPKPKASPSSSKSSESSTESESSAGKHPFDSFRLLRGTHNSTESESFSEVSNSSYHEESQSSSGRGKPKPPLWPFPVAIFDESGAGWFNGSEAWVMVPEYECDGSATYADNRRLPEVLTNPEYTISSLDRTEVLRRNTICGDLLKETCEERLPDGEYIFRVGGALSNDHTVNNSAWDFCGVRGRSMEELEFSLKKGKCHAGKKISAKSLCCQNTTARAALFDGVVVLSNIAGDALSEFDTGLLEAVLAESFSTVNGQLHGSVSITSWEMEGSALTVNFRLAFDPSKLGISINHYVALEELATRLSYSVDDFMQSGSFLSKLYTGLGDLPLGQKDVLTATAGATFVSLVYVDSILDNVVPSVSTASIASLDKTTSSDDLKEKELSTMSSFEHTSVVIIASVALTAFALAAFTVMSRSHGKRVTDEISESADALITSDTRESLEMASERGPDLF